jgi:hypothetical protein
MSRVTPSREERQLLALLGPREMSDLSPQSCSKADIGHAALTYRDWGSPSSAVGAPRPPTNCSCILIEVIGAIEVVAQEPAAAVDWRGQRHHGIQAAAPGDGVAGVMRRHTSRRTTLGERNQRHPPLQELVGYRRRRSSSQSTSCRKKASSSSSSTICTVCAIRLSSVSLPPVYHLERREEKRKKREDEE